ARKDASQGTQRQVRHVRSLCRLSRRVQCQGPGVDRRHQQSRSALLGEAVNLGELARPITIYWDLTPLPEFLPDYVRICGQVAAIKPLQLHLLDGGSSLSAACFSILEQVRNTPL